MPTQMRDFAGEGSSVHGTTPLDELDRLLGTSGEREGHSAGRAPLLADLDVRVMLQAVVAVVLLTVAGGLVARVAWARHARDAAFRQMLDGNARREYLRTVEGAEQFLTHPPLNGSHDAREENVVSLYSEALVHWVAQQPGELDAKALEHISRYQRLVKSAGK